MVHVKASSLKYYIIPKCQINTPNAKAVCPINTISYTSEYNVAMLIKIKGTYITWKSSSYHTNPIANKGFISFMVIQKLGGAMDMKIKLSCFWRQIFNIPAMHVSYSCFIGYTCDDLCQKWEMSINIF